MTYGFARVHQICIVCGCDFCAVMTPGRYVPLRCRACYEVDSLRARIEQVAEETTKTEIIKRVRGLP